MIQEEDGLKQTVAKHNRGHPARRRQPFHAKWHVTHASGAIAQVLADQIGRQSHQAGGAQEHKIRE